MNKKLISIITPVLNEEDSLQNYFTNILKATDLLSDKYNFEFIITDNFSNDNTYEILKSKANEDKRFKIFRLSKNYGYQKSLWTGYCQTNGDAVIPFDCDLQDPPSLLPDFIKKWEDGNKIVYGKRTSRSENFLKTKQIVDLPFIRIFFYYLINKISDNDIPRNAGDFMLIDKQIVDYIRNIHDHNIYIRGTIFSLGFSKDSISYERKERHYGKTKFNFSKSMKLAIDGIVSMSGAPLRLASYVGIFIAFVASLLSGFYIFAKFFFDINMPAGLTTVIVLILFGISINALFLGIIGEYIARLYDQRNNRPITIINESINN